MAMLNFFLGKRGFDLFNFIQNIHHGTSIDYTVTNCNNFFVYFLKQISYGAFALTMDGNIDERADRLLSLQITMQAR